MKIIADSRIPDVAEAFSSCGEVLLCNGRDLDRRLLSDADALLIRSVTTADANLLKDTPVRFVATATSGTDHVDVDYLNEAGIGFADAAGSNAQAVVEYVLSSLFVLASQYDFNLTDKTVGIIGCGNVGSRLQEMLRLLDVNCLINDPPLRDQTGDSRYLELEALCEADIISLHVPLTTTGMYPTRYLIDRQFLSRMKPDAVIVNTARGGVINENDLKAYLAANSNASAVFDVWENEPDIDQELLSAAVIGTPHIAGYSMDGKIRATKMIYDRFCKFFSCEKQWNPVYQYMDAGLHSLKISDEVDDHEALQFAVLSHYDVRSDAAALRRLLELDPGEQEFYFDELRNNYPVRSEFASMEICIDRERTELAARFRKLGFRVRED